MQLEHCVCDICGSSDSEVIWDKTQREKDQLLLGVLIRDEDGNIVHGTNVICKNCSLVYVTPRMTKESLDEFYQQEYRNIYKTQVGGESESRHGDCALQILSSNIKKVGSILDIGCSTGKLLDIARNMYGIEHRAGVEPSNDNRDIANLNHTTYKSIDDVSIEYDVVTMLNALEHVHSPSKMLMDIRKCLKTDGHLLISVPNLLNMLVCKPIDAYLSNAHIYNFTPFTIINLLWTCGYLVEQVILVNEEIGQKMYVLSSKTEEFKVVQTNTPSVEAYRMILKHLDAVYQISVGLNGGYGWEKLK